MIKKNDEFPLKITGCTSEGGGVGKIDGMAVFCENTAPGDTVLCHIIKAKSTYAVGKAVKIITPSPDRTEPDCQSFSSCGGCSYRHISYEAECRLKYEKVKDALNRLGHIDIEPRPIVGSPQVDFYRNKALYPVGRESSALKIGFYAKKSHRITDGENCLLQPEEFGDVVRIFAGWINKNLVTVYNPLLKKGLVRHLYLRKGFDSGEIMVTVVINGEKLPFSDELIDALKAVKGFKTLLINTNREDTNVVLGDSYKTLYGDGYITDTLCGIKIKLSPASFYQVNRAAAELLYKKAKEYAALDGSQTLLDLYCGTGTIGLSMAREVRSLIGVEIVPEAIEDAKINALSNGLDNTEFFCADASDAAKALKERSIKPDVVILDPPRKGCEEQLLKTVSEIDPDRIVYISCDPATLARDCEKLKGFGYTLREATPFDLFPRTAHVETAALLTKD